eukprot:5525200-Alexandrium_andersonii.AAC.1
MVGRLPRPRRLVRRQASPTRSWLTWQGMRSQVLFARRCALQSSWRFPAEENAATERAREDMRARSWVEPPRPLLRLARLLQ